MIADQLFDLAPDKFYRYYYACKLADAICHNTDSNRFIDLGATEGILHLAFPDHSVFQMDLHILPSSGVSVRGDARAIPFPDHIFDIVFALDILEHISPTTRVNAILEAIRITRKAAIFSFPADNPLNSRTETLLNHIEIALTNRENPFLQEHFLNGPVDHTEAVRILSDHFPYVRTFCNFSHTGWLLSQLMEAVLSMLPLALPLQKIFRRLYNTDSVHWLPQTPVYRLILVGSHSEIPSITPDTPAPDYQILFPEILKAVSETYATLQNLDLYARKMEQEVAQKESYIQKLLTELNANQSNPFPTDSVPSTQQNLHLITEKFTLLETAYKKLETALEDRDSAFIRLESAYRDLLSSHDSDKRIYQELSLAYQRLESEYRDLKAGHLELESNYLIISKSYRELETEHIRLESGYHDQYDAYQKLEQAYLAALDDLKRNKSALETLETEYKKLESAYQTLICRDQQRAGEITDLTLTLQTMKNTLRQSTNLGDRLQSEMRIIAQQKSRYEHRIQDLEIQIIELLNGKWNENSLE